MLQVSTVQQKLERSCSFCPTVGDLTNLHRTTARFIFRARDRIRMMPLSHQVINVRAFLPCGIRHCVPKSVVNKHQGNDLVPEGEIFLSSSYAWMKAKCVLCKANIPSRIIIRSLTSTKQARTQRVSWHAAIGVPERLRAMSPTGLVRNTRKFPTRFSLLPTTTAVWTESKSLPARNNPPNARSRFGFMARPETIALSAQGVSILNQVQPRPMDDCATLLHAC